jgi:aminotransferase in exopolysaccharide biosynthesis
MILAGINSQDEILGQSLTFVATYNALSYIGAQPIFIDVDKDTLGLSPVALRQFLLTKTERRSDNYTYNKITGRRIKACLPMHTFGLPCRIDEIAEICHDWNITLIEDAAESLGSYYKGTHTGLYGKMGVFSFNGNKTVTSGGGGALVTNDEALAKHAKHLSTQAKVPHLWAFIHDEVGYNYRMPNINAALACAQLEQLMSFVENKRELSGLYKKKFEELEIDYCYEINEAKANYWLNAIMLKDLAERDAFLEYTNSNGIMTRPVWELMHRLPMFKDAQREQLNNSEWIADRLVNIPSSVRIKL